MKIAFTTILISFFLFSNNLISQSWTETQKIVASDRNQNDFFSSEVDIDGNHAICGAEGKSSNDGGPGNQVYAGAAYIFENTTGSWAEVEKLTNPNPFAYDWFGTAVAISGGYAVVSAHRDDEDQNEANYLMNSGSAFIYERAIDGSWNLIQKIVASDRTENAWYGISVAIEGNTIVIGAQYERFDGDGENLVYGAGAAYIYERDENGIWNETQKIAANVRASDDLFGSSVAISEDVILVGAYKEDHNENESSSVTDTGAGYIFEKDTSGTWNQAAKLVAFDREPYDNFGSEVAIEGTTALIGAWGEDDDEVGGNNISFAGSAYIFEKTITSEWEFSQKIVASDREGNANFGLGLDISGETIVVGARYETQDVSGENELTKAGAAYFFEKESQGTWEETQKVVNSDRFEFDYFGYDVGMSRPYSIIGAFTESEDENGLNTESSAGSAYIFENSTCTPTSSTEVMTVCDSLVWIDGITYSTSNNSSTFLTANQQGCDSLVSLDLTINYSDETTESFQECDSFTWQDGNTFTQPNDTSTYILTNMFGCDSTIILNLELNYSFEVEDSLVVCDSLVWINGQTYYESNTSEFFTVPSQFGCDSLVHLNLTVIEIENMVLGCTYSYAVNYNPLATMEDGSCLITGCTDQAALNYNPTASLGDDSCLFPNELCPEGSTWNQELSVCLPSVCAGDLDNDGFINVTDLSLFLTVFGSDCE